MRRLAFCIALAAPAVPARALAAQDTLPRPRADSSARTLPPLEVRVTRSDEPAATVPLAVGVLRKDAIRRAQPTIGLDESLYRLPGVIVMNRYNYSVDQRVSLRGAGSRANFGLRGVKVVLDGVPQTLPDGQSQLTNLDLALVDRAEVLTGSAGALYGNASGGVLSFTTEDPLQPWSARLRVTGGSFGTYKWQSVAAARGSRVSGLLSLSRLATGGFRQHSAARLWQAEGKADYTLDERSTLGVRLLLADAPRAENPGALTEAEYAATRDSAAGTNILRGADKDVSQQQLALRYRWLDGRGAEVEAAAFGLLRDLANPLATAPPAPAPPTAGTYNTIGRVVGGLRASATAPLIRGPRLLRVTAGVDVQTMRDNRKNQRSDAGAPTGVFLADQRETVTELGPFAQVRWEPAERWGVFAAGRFDRLVFRVADHLLSDGVDNSGRRVMQAVSGSAGVSLRPAEGVTVYGNVATSFESPTTTELVNTQNGTVGFNTTLGPQRTTSAELGMRARVARTLDVSAAVFLARITDAIIQAREQDGRAFFENAGRVRSRGIELGAGGAPFAWLRLQGAYTYAGYTFSEYRIPNGATTDTLDGNRLAGVPRHFFRGTATVTVGSVVGEVDQMVSGDVYADDRNTVKVKGWGAGVTSVRLSGRASLGNMRFEPFAAVNNLTGRRYVGSVNINGFGGRLLEPAPGRNAYVGLEVGWGK